MSRCLFVSFHTRLHLQTTTVLQQYVQLEPITRSCHAETATSLNLSPPAKQTDWAHGTSVHRESAQDTLGSRNRTTVLLASVVCAGEAEQSNGQLPNVTPPLTRSRSLPSAHRTPRALLCHPPQQYRGGGTPHHSWLWSWDGYPHVSQGMVHDDEEACSESNDSWIAERVKGTLLIRLCCAGRASGLCLPHRMDYPLREYGQSRSASQHHSR